jgi:hypothetical protein
VNLLEACSGLGCGSWFSNKVGGGQHRGKF